MNCVRCRVSGRVQGVWFRASTQKQALILGLVGHAINQDDGGVEVLACGQDEDVKRLVDWLWQGPVLARVKNVTTEKIALDALPSRFVTE
ncbi:MAG: acylphosphatase [Gammaproteobacteria bacterium]